MEKRKNMWYENTSEGNLRICFHDIKGKNLINLLKSLILDRRAVFVVDHDTAIRMSKFINKYIQEES